MQSMKLEQAPTLALEMNGVMVKPSCTRERARMFLRRLIFRRSLRAIIGRLAQ